MRTATAAAGPSALSASRLDLEPRLQDDGGTGGGAPAQGPEKVFRPDQAALAGLVLPIPRQELDPSPEARLVVASGPGRVPRTINALAADAAALDNASAALLHHFPDQAVLQRFARLDPAAEQVPVPLAIGIAGTGDDHPGPGEADAISLVRVRRFRPERRSGHGPELVTRRRYPLGRDATGPLAILLQKLLIRPGVAI